MTRVETYLNENLRKRLDQVEQVHHPFKHFACRLCLSHDLYVYVC